MHHAHYTQVDINLHYRFLVAASNYVHKVLMIVIARNQYDIATGVQIALCMSYKACSHATW